MKQQKDEWNELSSYFDGNLGRGEFKLSFWSQCKKLSGIQSASNLVQALWRHGVYFGDSEMFLMRIKTSSASNYAWIPTEADGVTNFAFCPCDLATATFGTTLDVGSNPIRNGVPEYILRDVPADQVSFKLLSYTFPPFKRQVMKRFASEADFVAETVDFPTLILSPTLVLPEITSYLEGLI